MTPTARRWAALVLAGVLSASAGGCALEEPAADVELPDVTGSFGHPPHVAFDGGEPPSTAAWDVVIQGEGAAVTEDDLLVVDQVTYRWTPEGQEAASTYASGERVFVAMPELAEALPPVGEALVGQAVHSRVVAAVPPQTAGPDGEDAEDEAGGAPSLVIIDIHDRYPAGMTIDAAPDGAEFDGGDALASVAAVDGQRPRVTVPDSAAPEDLGTQVLVEGEGTIVTEGARVVTQYTGVVWRTGEEFDSTWDYGAVPKEFRLDHESVIAGWIDGLTGQRAGSRVMLTVPPDLGYGSGGNTAVGIAADETLVYIIDILGVGTHNGPGG